LKFRRIFNLKEVVSHQEMSFQPKEAVLKLRRRFNLKEVVSRDEMSFRPKVGYFDAQTGIQPKGGCFSLRD